MRWLCITVCLIICGCEKQPVVLRSHPYHFQISENLTGANPHDYSRRVANPDEILEFYRHKKDPDCFVALYGRRVEQPFGMLLKAPKSELVGIAKKLMPEATDVSAHFLTDKNIQFVVMKYLLTIDGREYHYWNFITQEHLDQFHITASFPVETPHERGSELMSIIETLSVRR